MPTGAVSIHAPTRGATHHHTAHGAVLHVSIHAPTRGATRCCSTRMRHIRFNSRAHAGRDSPKAAPTFSSVSIHAPTRGATPRIRRNQGVLGFNSRAHAGRDNYSEAVLARQIKFQFTRPRGARRVCDADGQAEGGFNSRAHAGRDRNGRAASAAATFQFTRPRGARPQPAALHQGRAVSIHAPTRGATARGKYNDAMLNVVSIHAPTRGATDWCGEYSDCETQFQFTRPRGARLHLDGPSRQQRGVSIHAPTRGATWKDSIAAWTHPRFNSRAHAGRDAHKESK